MPLYRYKAVAPGGAVSMGELDAANEGEILDRLRDQGLMPMQVAPAQTGAVAAPARGEARAPGRSLFARSAWAKAMAFTRESSRRCCAPGCRSTARSRPDRAHDDALRRVVPQGIRDQVRGAERVADPRRGREVFSRFYVSIVRAGEAGGALASVLTRLADTMGRSRISARPSER
jgi:general secretion pathway protein F